jgi:hypothetical protein
MIKSSKQGYTSNVELKEYISWEALLKALDLELEEGESLWWGPEEDIVNQAIMIGKMEDLRKMVSKVEDKEWEEVWFQKMCEDKDFQDA